MPRIYWPSFDANSEEIREDYFRRLLLLTVPWRNEEQIKDQYASYEERWISHMETLLIISPNAAADINKYVENQTKQLKMEQELYEKRRQQGIIQEIEEIEEEAEETLEVFNRNLDEEALEVAKTKLNENQKQIFELIINTISEQVIFLKSRLKKPKSPKKYYNFTFN